MTVKREPHDIRGVSLRADIQRNTEALERIATALEAIQQMMKGWYPR